MPTSKETYRSTLTRGMISPNDSDADMVIHVTGLSGDRSSLSVAIDYATVGRTLHPDDLTIPLRTATARWVRGADNGENAEALVYLRYDKRGRSVASDPTQALNIANIRTRTIWVPWWGKTLQEPTTTGIDGQVSLESDPDSGNPLVEVPVRKQFEVSVWEIEIPVVLSSSPIDRVDDLTNKVNDAPYTLGNKSFSKHELRFNGLLQSVNKLVQGNSVSYEYLVNYSFSRRKGGWYRSVLAKAGEGTAARFVARKELMYDKISFTDPPRT